MVAMKTTIFFFVTTLLVINVYSQVDKKTRRFDAKTITELNEPLIAAINNHIEVSKAKRIKNKNGFNTNIRW